MATTVDVNPFTNRKEIVGYAGHSDTHAFAQLLAILVCAGIVDFEKAIWLLQPSSVPDERQVRQLFREMVQSEASNDQLEPLP